MFKITINCFKKYLILILINIILEGYLRLTVSLMIQFLIDSIVNK